MNRGRSIWVVVLLIAMAALTLPAPGASVRVFRADLPASGKLPLPATVEVDKIMVGRDAIWYMARDCAARPCSPVVYSWNAAGITSYRLPANEQPLNVSDLVLINNAEPLLLTSQGVLELSGAEFQPSRNLGTWKLKNIAGSGPYWGILDDRSVVYLPFLPVSGTETRLSLPGTIEAWSVASDGTLWVALSTPDQPEARLYSVTSSGEIQPLNAANSLALPSVKYLFADRSNTLWIGAGDGRLIRKSADSFTVFGPESGLPGTALKSMAEDTKGDYYFLFQEGAGLPSQLYGIGASARFDAQPQFTRFDVPLLHSAIRAVAVDFQNGTWLAAGPDVTYRMQGLNGIGWPRESRSRPQESSAKEAPRGSLPTYVSAAAQLTPSTAVGPFSQGKFAILGSSNGLASNTVSSIVGDKLGNIYFTTGFAYTWPNEVVDQVGMGISRWDHRAYTNFNTANSPGLPSNTVHASIYDQQNDVIWFGTDKGMVRFNPNTTAFTTFLSGINVRDFRIDAGGNLWVATLGSGLYKIRTSDGATLAQYTSGNPSQLQSNRITSLAIDGLNNLFIGTDGGNVSQLNLNTNTWTFLNLPLSADSSRVFDLETDNSNNLWIALPFSGLMRRASNGTTTLFHAPLVGGGFNGTYRFLTLYRDGSGNLWISSGDFGGLGVPNTAFSFLPAAQVNAASPAFQNYNMADLPGLPVNSVLAFYSENGNAIWFGSPGAGAWRFGGPVDMPGWPQLLTGYPYYSSPVLADLNGDGTLEIIVGDTAGFVSAYKYDGSLLWKYDARNAVTGRIAGAITIQSSPAVADVDADGKPEVVVGLGGNALPGIAVGQGGVLILSNTGQLKKILYPFDITDVSRLGKQDGYAEGVLASPVLANVDDDPEPEIMVGAFDNLFYAFNADGSPVYSRDNDGDGQFDEDPGPGDWTPWTPLDATDDFPGWRGVDDDHNGVVDEGNVYDDDEDGLIDEDPPEWPFLAGDTTVSSAVVGDILRNGTPTIIFGTDHLGNGTPQDPRGGILNVLTPQAKQLPGFPKAPLEQVIWSSPVLVDLNGDGYWEIIHGTGLDLSAPLGAPPVNNLIGQLVYAWNRDGSSFVPGAGGRLATVQGRTVASFAVGDINNDGKPELVIATSSLRDVNGNLIDASGNPVSAANAVGQLVYAFNSDGSLVPNFPVRPYTISPGADLVGSPILADVNGDGFLDIIVPVGPGLIVLDHNGRAIPGMGLFENLQDTTFTGEITTTAAVADIDGDGILELVYMLGTGSGTGGILHVMKLGPVNSTVQRSWPMFRRIPSHSAIFDVLIGDAQAVDNGSNLVVTVQGFAGRNPITSVVANLSALGGSSSQALLDNGTGGDRVGSDGYFTFQTPSTGIAPGRYQIPITISDGVHTDSKTIFYYHAGTGKLLSVSKASIDFGSVGQGLDKEMHFSVQNVGNLTVTISGMSNSNPEFSVAIPGPYTALYPNQPPSGFPQALAPGQTLIVRLRLHPGINNALGVRSSTLTIQSDDSTNPNRTISLTGNAIALSGGIQAPTAQLNFGLVPVGSSADVYYTIQSVGVDPLIVKSIAFSDPAFSIYKLSNPPAPRKFEPGVSAPYILRFKPTQQITYNATLTVTTNDASHPTVTVPLNGVGSPGSGGCPYVWAPTSIHVSHTGATGSAIAVSTNAGCTWTATTNVPWIHFVSGANGNGPGTITYNVDANTTPLYQNGAISFAGQTIPVTQAPDVGGNTEAFVRQLYLDILSRPADSGGLNTWVNWINTGVYTRAQVASLFFQSQEFYGTGNYITKLYLAIMLRDPDYGGWTGWFNYLHNGFSQTDILNQFLASPEFQSRYGTLDSTGFVTLLYNNILNRAPDQAGLNQWVTWLNNGTYTRAQVANSFVISQEFDLRERNRIYADMLYIGFLRRAGETAGLDGWTSVLNNGTSLDQVVGGFITSPEYLARF